MNTQDNIAIEVFCHPEDAPVRDKEVENRILSELEYNQWAWCTVEVRATTIMDGDVVIASDWIGCCTYGGAQDFIENSGYYEDMVEQATGELIGLTNQSTDHDSNNQLD